MEQVEKLASSHNVSILTTPKDVMMWEYLCMKYYTNPILSIVNQTVKKYKGKRTSKLFLPDYYITVISQKFSGHTSVVRERMSEVNLPCDIRSFSILCSYMPVDYSINDAYMIYHMALTHTPQAITKAVQIAKGNNVYAISYIKAIIDKEQAISNIKMNDALQRIEQASSSADILNRKKVQNTQEDIEESREHWKMMVTGAQDEQMLRELYGDDI